jgi:hypothetical protein
MREFYCRGCGFHYNGAPAGTHNGHPRCGKCVESLKGRKKKKRRLCDYRATAKAYTIPRKLNDFLKFPGRDS